MKYIDSHAILLYKGKMSDGNEVLHLQKGKAPRILNHCIHWKRVVGQLHDKVAWQHQKMSAVNIG